MDEACLENDRSHSQRIFLHSVALQWILIDDAASVGRRRVCVCVCAFFD